MGVRRTLALAACLLGMASGAALAAEDGVRHAPPGQRHVACLQSALPATLPATAPADGPQRLLRVALTFAAADAAPTVEWLWRADEGAAARLEPHLLAYRMPCLNASLGAQRVVQEFWVAPATGELEASAVWPAGAVGGPQSSCYKGAETASKPHREVKEISKAMLYFRFVDGAEEPEVELIHHTGSSSAAEAARRQVSDFRRCPNGRTTAEWHQIPFIFKPADKVQPKFNAFELKDFLAVVKDVQTQRAHFDLNSMQCPFDVSFTLNQPAARNSAVAPGRDLNRTGFLSWLSGLKLDLPPDQEALMFTEAMTIHVPCLLVNLKPAG